MVKEELDQNHRRWELVNGSVATVTGSCVPPQEFWDYHPCESSEGHEG
jgi:hypothetical protein